MREATCNNKGRIRFAAITSASGSGAARRSSRSTRSSSTAFARAFESVAAMAARSASKALTGEKPSFDAAIASTPDPQPRSQNEPPGSSSSSSSRHSRVVGWVPVPNAWPGSITTSWTPGRTAGCSHGGRTYSRPPSRSGTWKRFQRSAQSSGTSSPRTSTRVPATSAAPSGSDGSSPGEPYSAYSTQPSPSTCSTPAGVSSSSAASTCSADSRGARTARRITASAQRPAHAREDRLVALLVGEVALGQGAAEILEHAALLVAQVARDEHVDNDLLVTGAARSQRRHPAAAQRDHGARLGPGGDVDLVLAVER